MKQTLVILLLALLLVPLRYAVSAQERDPDGAPPEASASAMEPDSYADSEDDIFSSSYEREMLSRRFFQKNLPPLSRREKIVWSFKTAKANFLL